MINSDIISRVLKGLVGQAAAVTAGSSSSSNYAYVCLGTTVDVSDGGMIIGFGEPAANTGYHRYLIGAYNVNGTGGALSLVQKCEVLNGVASNTETLYFDEALTDWPTIRYFGIAASPTGLPIAYGYIVDEDSGQPTTLTVTTGQVPIIRASQMQLSIQDSAELPVQYYNASIYTKSEGSTILDEEVWTVNFKTTGISKMISNTLCTGVMLTYTHKEDPTTTTEFEVGQILYIPNLRSIVGEDYKAPFYNANGTAVDAGIKVLSEQPAPTNGNDGE